MIHGLSFGWRDARASGAPSMLEGHRR